MEQWLESNRVYESVQDEANQYMTDFILQNPHLEEDANDLYHLMISEIEEGGSETGELESFKQSIDQLLEM